MEQLESYNVIVFILILLIMTQGTFLFIGDEFISNFDWQKRMPNFTVHSMGVADEQVKELLERLPTIEEQYREPDIILIMTGINNVIKEDYTFVDQIRRIVIRLSNHYPDSEILVNSLPNIQISFLVDNAIHHLNSSLREMARQTGSCFLDNFEILATKNTNLFAKDGIHLTSSSYNRWARSILEFVAFLLEDD